MKSIRRIVLGLTLAALAMLISRIDPSWAGEPGIPAGAGVLEAAKSNSVAVGESQPIPWNQVGMKAGMDYQGDGLVIAASAGGARLHCAFQRLDGEVTDEGLWLTSTVANQANDRFRVVASEVGREKGTALSRSGQVSVEGQRVRFSRPGLVEEYSVSMDGVRQDFVVLEKPNGSGELCVGLDVAGAKVEALTDGAQLVLKESGRKIAYNKLRAVDAGGRELPARVEVNRGLAIVVDDTQAVYPVRIDPTFSDANWVSMGGLAGVDGYVYAAVTDASGNLYIGGVFSVAGNVAANNIAEWNGSGWSALGSGVGGMYSGIFALAVSGNTLFAGGAFTNAGGVSVNNIAQWNGSSWSALGAGLTGQKYEDSGLSVAALAVSGSVLYVGGVFTNAGGHSANNIAQWNGITWSALGSGVDILDGYGSVSRLLVASNVLYVGGLFSAAGSVTATNIAQWNGITWSALGPGLGIANADTFGGGVFALALSGSTLYAGGSFANSGGISVNSIAQWDGSSWSALGVGVSGLFSQVYALAVSGSALYVGGSFTNAGDVPADNIAKWDGSNWSALGSGISGQNPEVNVLAASGSALYVGGHFTNAGGLSANEIAQWNGSGWSTLESQSAMNGQVLALAVAGNTLYAGGDFTTAGNVQAKYVAQWNGSGWSALGSGTGGAVNALAAAGNTLYAGGNFTNAGGSPANYVAQWNGSSWSALGSGTGGAVNALAVAGDTLYAAGYFTNAGGIPANSIAQWNGSNWSGLGSGIGAGVYTGAVNALAVSGSTLYVGGYFETAGGFPAYSVAQWNGSSWSAIGAGLADDEVYALAVAGGNLYAGGNFEYPAGVAQWNGSSWSPVGLGIGGTVNTLTAWNNTLFAGGNFTSAGGVSANYIAVWNGSSWSALGSGMNKPVLALAMSSNDLYAGGQFTVAGGKSSAYATYAVLFGPPNLSINPAGNNVIVSWPDTGSYTLQQKSNLTLPGGWITSGYAVSTTNSINSVTITPSPGSLFFRLLQP